MLSLSVDIDASRSNNANIVGDIATVLGTLPHPNALHELSLRFEVMEDFPFILSCNQSWGRLGDVLVTIPSGPEAPLNLTLHSQVYGPKAESNSAAPRDPEIVHQRLKREMEGIWTSPSILLTFLPWPPETLSE